MGDEIRRDQPTVTPDGQPLIALPPGVNFHSSRTIIDDRGSVCELYDPRWNWHPDPLVFAYMFTLRPGMVKGWGLHKLHDDRYFIISGEMEVVLYDERPDSPTRNTITKIALSEFDRRLMSIPAGVWHADVNIGSKDVLVVNFPTTAYDHENPDKYRLPIDTDRIPYSFGAAKGW